MNEQHKIQYLYLTLEMHGHMFALPIDTVRKIITLTRDIPRATLPQKSKYINSVIKLEEELITVIDFEDIAEKASVLGTKQLVALLNDNEKSVGILAQNAGLIEFTDNEIAIGGTLAPESFMYEKMVYTYIDLQKLYVALRYCNSI